MELRIKDSLNSPLNSPIPRSQISVSGSPAAGLETKERNFHALNSPIKVTATAKLGGSSPRRQSTPTSSPRVAKLKIKESLNSPLNSPRTIAPKFGSPGGGSAPKESDFFSLNDPVVKSPTSSSEKKRLRLQSIPKLNISGLSSPETPREDILARAPTMAILQRSSDTTNSSVPSSPSDSVISSETTEGFADVDFPIFLPSFDSMAADPLEAVVVSRGEISRLGMIIRKERRQHRIDIRRLKTEHENELADMLLQAEIKATLQQLPSSAELRRLQVLEAEKESLILALEKSERALFDLQIHSNQLQLQLNDTRQALSFSHLQTTSSRGARKKRQVIRDEFDTECMVEVVKARRDAEREMILRQDMEKELQKMKLQLEEEKRKMEIEIEEEKGRSEKLAMQRAEEKVGMGQLEIQLSHERETMNQLRSDLAEAERTASREKEAAREDLERKQRLIEEAKAGLEEALRREQSACERMRLSQMEEAQAQRDRILDLDSIIESQRAELTALKNVSEARLQHISSFKPVVFIPSPAPPTRTCGVQVGSGKPVVRTVGVQQQQDLPPQDDEEREDIREQPKRLIRTDSAGGVGGPILLPENPLANPFPHTNQVQFYLKEDMLETGNTGSSTDSPADRPERDDAESQQSISTWKFVKRKILKWWNKLT